MLKFKLEGIEDLKAAMNAVGKKAAREAAFVAVQHACRPIVEIAKAKARRKTGALADSITVRVGYKKKNKGGGAYAYIGPASKYRGADMSQPAKYAHLVEKGSARSAAFPFMRPAIDTGAQAALTTLGQTFGVALSIKIDALPEVRRARLKGRKKS